ncbi:MAG: hypothetical protein QXU79_02485 [Candidatus Micrarchaeaceae archaeon]
MRILSADTMAGIPDDAVRSFVKKYAKAKITDDAVKEIARILNTEAAKISRFAVKNAKREKRNKITKKDIMDYVLKHENGLM